jgi:hypothetical protein
MLNYRPSASLSTTENQNWNRTHLSPPRDCPGALPSSDRFLGQPASWRSGSMTNCPRYQSTSPTSPITIRCGHERGSSERPRAATTRLTASASAAGGASSGAATGALRADSKAASSGTARGARSAGCWIGEWRCQQAGGRQSLQGGGQAVPGGERRDVVQGGRTIVQDGSRPLCVASRG